MGRASISIAITSNFNSKGIDAAIRKAEQLATSAVHYQGRFGKAAVDMGASMGQAAARLVSMGKAVADLGDRLTMGVTVPMGLAATASVMAAAKIDTAWYNVRKTVDMTEEGYERLKRSAMELSETQPVDAETILNIEALGGQLGITNGYLEDFAKVVSGLDIATNIDADTAATELAQFRNIVQMSEDDLDNWASTVVDLGNHTATTESDMVNLAMRFASAGHIAGMSNSEILGLSAALSGLGMRAEAGGSAISRTVNDINNAVALGGEKLEKWANLVGKTPEQFAEAWRAAPMDEFIDVLTHISDAGSDMGAVLDELGITQIRQSDAMRRLASSGDYVRETVERANRAWEENSALTQEVERRNESLQARWDTLVNRFTNDLARIGQPLAELGFDALEGLEPVIQGVGDLTQAFADASPDVQQFAFNLAAVAMAAGPVLSIAGRVMQAFGNMGIRVGRVTQQWGVYQEAMRTTDISLLNTLSNNQSAAASFGASRNAIVKAAGGLDRYNVAYAKTTDAIRRNIEQQTRRTAYEEAYQEALAKGNKTEEQCVLIAEKAAHSRETTAVVTARQKEAIKDLNDSIDESNVKTKLNTAAVTEQEVQAAKASRTFGKMGDAIKGALLGFAGMAVTGAAIAGITWLATQLQLAHERAENLRLATDGLRESLTRTNETADEGSRVWGSSISTVDAAIEKQAQLGQTFEQNNTAAQTSIHTLDRAAETIREYGNRSDLSASEMYRLKDAVDTVNEACGTQYGVLEDGTVALQDETGAWQENKQAILDNIEARKQQIKLEAVEANYKAAYEQEITAKKALRDAQLEYNDAFDRYNELVKKYNEQGFLDSAEGAEYEELRFKVWDLRDALERAREAADAAGESTQFYDSMLEQLMGSAEAASGSLEQLLSSDMDFTVAFEGIEDADRNLRAFSMSAQDLGINFQALEGLSSESANAIAGAFDGTASSVVKAMEGIDEAKYILENIGNDWYNSFSAATQGVIGSVAAMRGMTLAELRAMAIDFGIKGEEATNAFMRALDSGIAPQKAADLAKSLSDAFGDSLNPDQVSQAVQAYMDAIAGKLSEQDAIQAAIDAIRNTLSGANFSDEGTNAGHTFFAAFNESIQQSALDSNVVYSDTGQAIGRVLADGTVVGLAEGQPAISAEGAKVPESYGQGATANAGAASSSGNVIVDALMGILTGGVGRASGIGSDTGTGYGDAVAAQGAVAEQAAINTLGLLLVVWLLGIESAKQAGTKTGSGFAEALAQSGQKAVPAAQAISIATGTAFGAGAGTASAAGTSLGQAFASAVWTSGGQAIAYARSIRNSVKDIFSDMPTANIKVNVTRTSTPSSFGGHAVRYAALPSQVPVMPVPSYAGASRAAVVAERAVQRVSATGARSSTASSVGQAVTAVVRNSSAPVDYDTMYRVVKSGVAAAIRDSGGLAPVVELDGRRVSRQLAGYIDSDLNRLREMRG